MERNLKGAFNVLNNGDFLKSNNDLVDFPEAWFQIGGDNKTRWMYKHVPLEKPAVEINNSTALRAGIIQVQEASLEVGNYKEWLIKLDIKSGSSELQAYLRIYPISLNGDAARPWEFSFKPGLEPEVFKQVVSVHSGVWRLRLETGVMGPGHLFIYKLSAYPLSLNRLKKRIEIKHIQTVGEIIKPLKLEMPIPLKMPVTVQANVKAEIRDLMPARDRVQIYGSTMIPLATSSCGRAQIEIFGHGFQESSEDVTANQTILASTIRDVSALSRFSFVVYNFGILPAYVQIGLSPDGIHWTADGEQKEVRPEKLLIITAGNFLRYTKISYWADGSTKLRIWIQAQN